MDSGGNHRGTENKIKQTFNEFRLIWKKIYSNRLGQQQTGPYFSQEFISRTKKKSLELNLGIMKNIPSEFNMVCVCVCVFVNSFGYSEEEKRPVFLHRMNRKLGNFYLITNKRTNKFFFISHHYYSCRKFLFSNYKQTNNLSFHFNYSQSENEKKDLKTIRFFHWEEEIYIFLLLLLLLL